jgi:DNA-binding transcriptional ArsR family regulator
MPRETIDAAEAFKALGDPIRWSIVQQVARQDELAASVLEDTLPVSKPTISYHTKILTQAGLIEVRKRGRNYFYRLCPDAVEALREALSTLTFGPRVGESSTTRRRPKRSTQQAREHSLQLASGGNTPPPVALLTW